MNNSILEDVVPGPPDQERAATGATGVPEAVVANGMLPSVPAPLLDG